MNAYWCKSCGRAVAWPTDTPHDPELTYLCDKGHRVAYWPELTALLSLAGMDALSSGGPCTLLVQARKRGEL